MVGFFGELGSPSTTAIGATTKFVFGKSGRVFRLPPLSPHIPLTATASRVRSALLKRGLLTANAELKVDDPLGESLEILRLARGESPANRFYILGHYDRVCKFYLFHSIINLAETLPPRAMPCQ
ncbi:hypothetical protein ES705_32637 [subsurface metagenome]